MTVVRFLLIPFLAGLLAVILAAAARADSGIDAAGQFFLRFDFGSNLRDAGPRFGLRLGAQPAPTLTNRAAPDSRDDFTSSVALSFDGAGRAELSFADLRMAVLDGDAAAAPDPIHSSTVLGFASSRQIPLRSVAPAPLVTAAGPAAMRAGHSSDSAASALRQAAGGPDPGQARWAFHRLQRGAQSPDQRVMGPRFRRLAASLLRGHQDAAPAPLAEPAKAFAIATAEPRTAAPGAGAGAVRWQFRPVMAAPPAATAAVAHYAAVLLAPHAFSAQSADVVALAPAAQPAQPDGAVTGASLKRLAVGQWVFRDVAGPATS